MHSAHSLSTTLRYCLLDYSLVDLSSQVVPQLIFVQVWTPYLLIQELLYKTFNSLSQVEVSRLQNMKKSAENEKICKQ